MSTVNEPSSEKQSASVTTQPTKHRGQASSEWRKAQNRSSQKTYRDKKRRMLREIHLRAIDADARAASSQQNSASRQNGAEAVEPGSTNDTAKDDAKPQDSASRASELAPIVSTEEAPADSQPRVRKVRTMFPFDLSNPFQFRETEIARRDADGKIIDVYPEHLTFKTRTSELKRTYPG